MLTIFFRLYISFCDILPVCNHFYNWGFHFVLFLGIINANSVPLTLPHIIIKKRKEAQPYVSDRF